MLDPDTRHCLDVKVPYLPTCYTKFSLDSVFKTHDAVDDGLESLGADGLPGDVERVGHHVGVRHVQLTEHLPRLIVPTQIK